MARIFHHHLALLLLVSLLFLLAAGLTESSAAVDAPGGKKVTITTRYAAAAPAGKKKNLHIVARYTDEDAGGDTKYFSLDGRDDEPIGVAMQYLLASLEKLHGDEQASRAEL